MMSQPILKIISSCSFVEKKMPENSDIVLVS